MEIELNNKLHNKSFFWTYKDHSAMICLLWNKYESVLQQCIISSDHRYILHGSIMISTLNLSRLPYSMCLVCLITTVFQNVPIQKDYTKAIFRCNHETQWKTVKNRHNFFLLHRQPNHLSQKGLINILTLWNTLQVLTVPLLTQFLIALAHFPISFAIDIPLIH